MSGELQTGFDCTVCGERHDVLPLEYSVNAPQAVASIPPEEIEQRIVITPDQCVIDNSSFYLRGRILIPVPEVNASFIWGVWAEIGPKAFVRANELWQTEGREQEPPFPGWLNNDLFLFGDTINLELNVHTQPVGQRPQFRISDPNHPLARQQREGLTIEEIQDIAEMIFHRGQPA
jgi:hypothetical protein